MTEQLTEQQQGWSSTKKASLLFLITYLFLYMFPFPITDIPFVGDLMSFYGSAMDSINLWVGNHILGIASLEKIENTGSGDTTFDYVRLLTNVLLSLSVAVLIFIFTRKQKNYTKLYSGIIIYARYYVGLYMIIYGLVKLNGGQFRFPGIGSLEQTYGNSSPMGLLWTFMGYSKSYCVFSGLGEITGGFLLFFRRTTVLGCLISVIVMLNVVMLNFSYDVPVKLFSIHLVLISMIILTPNILRLYNFFILNKTTEITPSKLILPKRWMRIGRLIFKPLIIIAIPAFIIIGAMFEEAEYQTDQSSNGSYKAESFLVKKDSLSATAPDTTCWNKMVIDDGYVKITTRADSTTYYQSEIDTVKKTIELSSFKDSTIHYSLAYKNEPDNHFSISGLYKADFISVSFKKKALNDYSLVNRGFHWINEYPYNR